MVGLLFRYVVMYISFCSRGSINGALTKSASEDKLMDGKHHAKTVEAVVYICKSRGCMYYPESHLICELEEAAEPKMGDAGVVVVGVLQF